MGYRTIKTKKVCKETLLIYTVGELIIAKGRRYFRELKILKTLFYIIERIIIRPTIKGRKR